MAGVAAGNHLANPPQEREGDGKRETCPKAGRTADGSMKQKVELQRKSYFDLATAAAVVEVVVWKNRGQFLSWFLAKVDPQRRGSLSTFEKWEENYFL